MRHKYHWVVFPAVVVIVALSVGAVAILSEPQKQADTKTASMVPVIATKPRLPSAVTNPSTIKRAIYKADWRHESRSDTLIFRYFVDVTNNSRQAISELAFYVRYKEQDRTVPIGECLEFVKIPSGIEPNETKRVEFTIPTSTFEFEYQHPFVNPTEMMELAIVSTFSNNSEPLYKLYAGSRTVSAKFENNK